VGLNNIDFNQAGGEGSTLEHGDYAGSESLWSRLEQFPQEASRFGNEIHVVAVKVELAFRETRRPRQAQSVTRHSN
jgi:hypothetical protein